MRLAQGQGPAPDPPRHPLQHLQGLRAAREGVHVEEAGHDLVQGVEGRPRGIAPAQAIEELLGEGAQVAAAERGLALRQLGHQRLAAGLHRLVAQGRVEQRAGREVVAGEVAAQLVGGLLPSAEGLRGARQPRGDPEHVQQAVGLEAHDVGAVPLQGVRVEPGPEAHPRQWEGPRAQRHGVGQGRGYRIGRDSGRGERSGAGFGVHAAPASHRRQEGRSGQEVAPLHAGMFPLSPPAGEQPRIGGCPSTSSTARAATGS